MATATALEDFRLVRIDKQAMVRVLHDDPTFSELFTAYFLSRNIRIEENLVDQLFNSSEKRLARLLLLMAYFGKIGQPGHAGREDRRHALPRQFLHEHIQEVWILREYRWLAGAQPPPEHPPA